MKTLSNSQIGYKFEDVLCKDLIQKLGGRVATKQEQIKQQVDYILDDGTKIDVKYQPQAYKYKTINIEICEYQTSNPNNNNMSYWYTSTSTVYIWYVGNGKAYWFDKADLMPFVDSLVNGADNKYTDEVEWHGGKISTSNGNEAKAISATHGSKRLDNAITIRMPISIIKDLPGTIELGVDNNGNITNWV